MVSCPRCGTLVKEDDTFCPNCGSSLTLKPSEVSVQVERHTRGEENCFGERERERDYLGLVPFGFFLVVVGIIFILNQHIVADFTSWVDLMANEQALIRPPERLITGVALFFGLIGLSDFAMAGIRLMVDKFKRRIMADVLSGVALVLFAYLISLYGKQVLTWQSVLAIEAVSCGLLIILYTLLRYVLLK